MAQTGPGATPDVSSRGTFSVVLGAGPSGFSGMEGGPVGVQGVAGVEYRRGRSPLSIRAEVAYHQFGAQALYPCILQGPPGCYETSQRATTATTLDATYRLAGGRRARRAVYALAGVGLYASRRVAARYPDCSPDRVCASPAERATYRDAGAGVNAGLGLDLAALGWPVFMELRYHNVRPITRDRAGTRDTRFAAYSLLPFTVGVRF